MFSLFANSLQSVSYVYHVLIISLNHDSILLSRSILGNMISWMYVFNEIMI